MCDYKCHVCRVPATRRDARPEPSLSQHTYKVAETVLQVTFLSVNPVSEDMNPRSLPAPASSAGDVSLTRPRCVASRDIILITGHWRHCEGAAAVTELVRKVSTGQRSLHGPYYNNRSSGSLISTACFIQLGSGSAPHPPATSRPPHSLSRHTARPCRNLAESCRQRQSEFAAQLGLPGWEDSTQN